MDEESGSQQTTPRQVQELIDEIRRFSIEPELCRINERHWRITFTIPPPKGMSHGLDMELDIKRSPTGRIGKPHATALNHAGVIPDWRKMMTSFYKSLDAPPVAEITQERSVESAPAQVRRQYGILVAARPPEEEKHPTPIIRVGREDGAWVIGVDFYPCDCRTLGCEHGYSLRLYYSRKGDSWRPDRNRMRAVVWGIDVSDSWRDRYEAQIASLLSGNLPDVSPDDTASAVRGDVSSAPASVSNSVAVRKSTVRRV